MIRLLLLALLCSGCAAAPFAVGIAVEATVGSIGIWQREQHTDELRLLREEIKKLREQFPDIGVPAGL